MNQRINVPMRKKSGAQNVGNHSILGLLQKTT